MSANPIITANDVVKYISQILNIDVSDRLTFQDILDDLASVNDLPLFRMFMKERFNYERFRYLTGYQKFVALLNEFKKENAPKLDEAKHDKVNSFASILYKKTTDCFDEVYFLIQEGNDMRGKKISYLIGKKFMNEPKEIKVLELIGNREVLCKLCRNDKPLLEEKIYQAVYKLALEKQYPHLALENKKSYEGIETMEKLKLGLRR